MAWYDVRMKNTQKSESKKASPLLGILPYIGIILFIISILPIIFGGLSGDWQRQVLLNAIVYMIGWAGIGSGISHIFFGKKISESIGFKSDPYEFEVGFAGLSFGIVGVLAPYYNTDFWLAIILVSSIYRIGCGIGHIKQMIISKNYAINNTAILFPDFIVPAFLLFGYFSWIA